MIELLVRLEAIVGQLQKQLETMMETKENVLTDMFVKVDLHPKNR